MGVDDDALCLAAAEGQLEMVNRLLDAKADVHAQDDEALRCAAYHGHIQVFERLLNEGATISDRTLCSVSAGGHLRMLNHFLEISPYWEVAAVDEALEGAIESGHVKVVERLLKLGAQEVDSLLHHAIYKGHAEIVDLLLDAGARYHGANGGTLESAVINGHLDIVNSLLGAKASPDGQNLRDAARRGHLEIVDRLIEAKGDVDHQVVIAATRGLDEDVYNRMSSILKGKPPADCQDLLRSSFATGRHSEIMCRLFQAGATFPSRKQYRHDFVEELWESFKEKSRSKSVTKA